MKKNYSFYIALGALALSASSLKAQTQRNDTVVNRVIIIENEYTPEIMDASKINTLPAVEAPVVQQQAAEYATAATPFQQLPAETMQPFPVMVTPPSTPAGYIRAGYGNYNNLDVMANYLFTISPQDKLDAFFSMNGMKGKLDNMFEPGEKWKAHYYRTRAALDYRHKFRTTELQTAGQFGLSNFNTLPTPGNWGDYGRNQKYTSGSVLVGAQSTDNQLPMNFITSGEVLIYKRKHELSNNESREGIFRLKGDLFAPIAANGELLNQIIGLNVEMNYVANHASSNQDQYLYDFDRTRVDSETSPATRVNFRNYTTVALNPYYTMNNGTWNIRAGINVDLAFNFGTKVRVSPDITAQYTIAKNYLGYIQATGGRILNDFRHLEQVNPYAMMGSQPINTYEQVNAAIGFKGSPVDGLWFHVAVAFQNLKNDLHTPLKDYTWDNKTYYYTTFANTNTQNTSVTGDISYKFNNIVKTGLGVTYYSWTADDEMALKFKPQLELNWTFDLNPVEGLNIGASYTHIKRCKPFDDMARTESINALGAKVSYNFFAGVSVYAQVNNLLNRKYMWYDGYAAERFNFLGGLIFSF